MRRSRFSEEQILTNPREADRSTVAETAKKNKLGEQTIYSGASTLVRSRRSIFRRQEAVRLSAARSRRALHSHWIRNVALSEVVSPGSKT
jgi:putative transposase